MASYRLSHSGTEVDKAVAFGKSPDTAPKNGSTNGVTSGGVYNSVRTLKTYVDEKDTNLQAGISQLSANKQDTLTFDNAPTQGSVNPVTSGGVYSAIATEADERLRADRAQQALITTEISYRQSADAETRTYLTNEIRDRENADDLLRDAIANIRDDLDDRIDALRASVILIDADGKFYVED